MDVKADGPMAPRRTLNGGGGMAGVDLGYILHFASDSKCSKQENMHSITGPNSNHDGNLEGLRNIGNKPFLSKLPGLLAESWTFQVMKTPINQPLLDQ